ncbi:MAG: hypothetical protein MK033_02570 [Candidatus Caenarcaniphilales bacterium]|nr:hypothetical protein [Candidatus Caenarcaniphilales bacterium]
MLKKFLFTIETHKWIENKHQFKESFFTEIKNIKDEDQKRYFKLPKENFKLSKETDHTQYK